MKHLRLQCRQENWLSPFLLYFWKRWVQAKVLPGCNTESRQVCRESILLSGFQRWIPHISKSTSNCKSFCQFLLPCYIPFLILHAVWKNPKKRKLTSWLQASRVPAISSGIFLSMSVMPLACACPEQVNCIHNYSETFQMHWIYYSHRDFRSTFHHCCTHSNEEETTLPWVSEPLRVEQLGHK